MELNKYQKLNRLIVHRRGRGFTQMEVARLLDSASFGYRQTILLLHETRLRASGEMS